MAIYDISFSMAFDFSLKSFPTWFADQGSVRLSVKDASVELTLLPQNNEGQL
jgi:hypothetical protein